MSDAQSKTVIVATDGACKGNPGPGGWGAVLRWGDVVKKLSGGRTRHDEQSYGADGGDRSTGRAETAL